MPINEFKNKLSNLKNKPDAIFVTCVMSYWYYGLNETIKIIKSVYSDIPIVLGGVYATLWTEHAKKNILADYVVPGYDEKKILDLLNQIFHLQNKIKTNFFELIPDYTLYKKMYSAAIMLSRGCPFNCNYCASNLLYPIYQNFQKNKILKLLDFFQIKNVQNIAFYDDALLYNSKNVFIPVFKEIIKRKYKFNFHLPNAIHAKYMTDEIARLMFLGGVKTIKLGIESIDYKWHKKNGDKLQEQEWKKCIKILYNNGFNFNNIAAYILIGLPDQSFDDVYNTINIVHNAGIQINLAYYSPIPNTSYWDISVKQFPVIEDEPLMTNSSVFTSLNTEGYDKINKLIKYVSSLNN